MCTTSIAITSHTMSAGTFAHRIFARPTFSRPIFGDVTFGGFIFAPSMVPTGAAAASERVQGTDSGGAATTCRGLNDKG